MAFDFLEDFGKAFVPKRARPYLKEYVQKAGIRASPYKFFGVLFYITLVLTFGIFMTFIWPFVSGKVWYVVFFGALFGWAVIQGFFIIGVITIVYFFLDLRIYGRIQFMENVFPDYLTLVSTNLKGGMHIDRALFAAIKPRFGPLAEEMTLISKKVVTGYDLGDVLMEFSHKYESPTIRRSMNLLVGEIDTGGKISYIIDQITGNMKRTQKLKAEMSASVVTYVIFIGAIVVIIAPALFALSYHLLSFISDFTVKLAEQGTSSSSLPFKFSKEGLDTNGFKNFAYAAVALTAFFSSMIVSIIERGNIKGGLKYVVMFMIGAFVVFSVFMAILNLLFSGIQV